MNEFELPEPIIFDWDKGNIDKNLKKHGVTNEEAEEVYSDRYLLVSDDKKHSSEEERRYQCLGETDNNRLLFISFTMRNNKIRIISVRDASKKERKKYAEKAK